MSNELRQTLERELGPLPRPPGSSASTQTPARAGAASRVNYNTMKNYQSPVLTSDYLGLLQQRGMYPEPMHNDEYCASANKFLVQRLRQLRSDPRELVPGEPKWLLRLYNLQAQFLLLMFPRHSAIGDVGDPMGVSCSLLVFDCMCLVLACYTALMGGIERATRRLTDSSHPDTIRALLALHGPEAMVCKYTQIQLLHSWECMAKRVRDVWPTRQIIEYRWCLMLRTADLCSFGERERPKEDGYTVMQLDAGPKYLQPASEDRTWQSCSARYQQQLMFFFVQTELPYYVINEEVLPREVQPASAETDARARKKQQKNLRKKKKLQGISREDGEPALAETDRIADELCREVLGEACSFARLTEAFDKHFSSVCDNTNNEAFVKDMARRWADAMIYPGAKCYAFFENKYSAAPDTSEILRFLFSVALRTWIEHTLPRQKPTDFVQSETTGRPALADVGRSMLLQQMIGLHSSEVVWDLECYIEDSDAWRYLMPAHATAPDARGYQMNNTSNTTLDLGDTEVFCLERMAHQWSVPVRDRDTRKTPVVVRLCGEYWTYSCGKYYRCRSLCQAFVLWLLFVMVDCEGNYYRPTGDHFDMGFMLATLEELWNLEQSATGAVHASVWVDAEGREAAEGEGILVLKKRIDT